MKIIKLIAQNFKGLKAIEIVPDEHFQIISGRNAQGKTSVLDSIWTAIAGKDALKATDKPIRDGESKAMVSVELDDIIVTRKWAGDKTTLEVTAKDGAKYSSPQTMLDGLIGKLSFDPLSFANQEEKKQKSTLQELVGIDFTKLDADRKQAFEERTDLSRAAKKLEGALSELPFPKAGTPTEAVSVNDIVKELNAANETIRTNEKQRESLIKLRGEVSEAKNDIIEIRRNLKQAEDAYEEMTKKGIELKAIVENLVDPDTTEIQTRLENVEVTNKAITKANEYRRLESELKEYAESVQYCTDKIADVDRLKSDTLQAASFPVKGLGFDDEGVTFNGIPFKQCSGMERLKVSTAMAMSLNPKLKVIRITDGSLLDSTNLEVLHNMAKEQDFQVWLEIVGDANGMGVVIEDGQIKEVGVNEQN